MKTYRVELSCTDCTGVDPMGCNDGDPWYLCSGGGEPINYSSRDVAEDDLRRWKEDNDCGPWRGEVVEGDDEER